MGDTTTVLDDGVVEGITQRLSLLPDVHLPFSLSSQGNSLSQSDKKAHLVDLLRRDAAVFLERHGSKLSCSELQEFDVLKEDYEVSWHLERLKTSMDPTAERKRAHNAVVKNRRLAYMDKLIQDGEFFSEDAMKMRAPLLYYEYLGKFQDPLEKSFARPGEKWSDMLIRQREEVEYEERLKKQREEAGMPGSDEEQEEEEEDKEKEEEEEEEDKEKEDAKAEEEDGQGQQVTQGEEVEYRECLKKQRVETGILKSDEEQEEEEEDEEEEEEDGQGREGTQMEEVSLLIDAIAQLDEPFQLMIVGEFNSGKSSVINSLLGKKYLNEGVLPTTNEITVLKHTSNGNHAKERSERHPDGHFIHYLPAGFLKQMNLVDTPGTNVILKRQQRLTEEFIPRADLILFVLSADRPFTESETTFLQYIRQWGKKIIFLLNKSDIYSDARELEEVLKFVESNAQRLLSMDQAAVYPVSARKALLAKTEAIRGDGGLDVEKLHRTSDWESSGFGKLESFISEFLGISSDAGAERKRLKLLTPLGIALALLEACEKQLAAEWEKAVVDFEVLNQLFKQLDTCEKAVEDDAFMRSQVIFAQINATKDRAEKFVDVILRLSNINAMARYLLGGDRKGKMPVESGFDEQVMGSVQTDIRTVLEERHSWIKDNLKKQASSFRDLLINRWPAMTATNNDWHSGDEWGLFTPDNMNKRQSAIDDVLNGFDIQAAKVLLEQEIKEVVVTTFGTLGAASVSASVLTSILPSTLEDLVALGICSAGGFMGVWNLPKRRTEAKRKIQQVVKSFVNQIEAAMQAETREAVEELKEEIGAIIKPYQISVVAEKDRVSSLQRQVQEMVAQVQALRLRVQNLGTL